MKYAAFRCIVICLAGISFNSALMLFAENCKCSKNPGPGGGVQCAKDQIATCDPSSGECECTCDSVERGKTKKEYQAFILSKVLKTDVKSSDLTSPEYGKFALSFRESRDDKGTFYFDKPGSGRDAKVKIGVPGWLEEVLCEKSGTSFGPGASLQNCPNGNCGAQEGTGNQQISVQSGANFDASNCGAINLGNGNTNTLNCGPPPVITTTSFDVTQPPLSADGHPRVSLKFYIDKPVTEGKFAFVCDRACQLVEPFCSFQGVWPGTEVGYVANHREIAMIDFHRDFPSVTWCQMTIESLDKHPIHVLKVSPIVITEPR